MHLLTRSRSLHDNQIHTEPYETEETRDKDQGTLAELRKLLTLVVTSQVLIIVINHYLTGCEKNSYYFVFCKTKKL